MHPAHTLICLSKGGLVITTHRIKVKPNKLREVMDIPLISLATLLLLKIICRLKSYAPCPPMSKREKKVKAVYSSIETGLTLLGAIAVEDKLQESVRETLVRLGAAGIKVWVLTGDKKETAINISFSCGHFMPAPGG